MEPLKVGKNDALGTGTLGHERWYRAESKAGGRFERPGEERPQQATPIWTTVSEARAAGCDRHINTREDGSRREIQVRDAFRR